MREEYFIEFEPEGQSLLHSKSFNTCEETKEWFNENFTFLFLCNVNICRVTYNEDDTIKDIDLVEKIR